MSSTATKSEACPGYAFRGRKYAQIRVSLDSPRNEASWVCLDTGCGMSLVDRKFLFKNAPTVEVSKMESPIKVRGMGSKTYDASEFAVVDFYILTEAGTFAHFQREIHIVDDLSANLLLGTDIAVPEGWVIDLETQKLTLPHCFGLHSQIVTQTRAPGQAFKVFAKEKTHIPPHSRKLLRVCGKSGVDLVIPDHDTIYEPLQQTSFTAFPQLVASTCPVILVQNDSSIDIFVSAGVFLVKVIDVDADSMNEIEEEQVYHLAQIPVGDLSMKRLIMKGVLAAAAFSSTTSSPRSVQREFHEYQRAFETKNLSPAASTRIEKTLFNNVTIYGNDLQAQALEKLVHNFRVLWTDQKKFAIPPNNEEMTIPLVKNWETRYKPGQARVYTVGGKDREVIDKTFDELHNQGRLRWTDRATPFSFPCFVVWKRLTDGTRKGRVVIDTRALNHIVMPDAYPIPTQADILSALSGCPFISTIDCASFFYQLACGSRTSASSYCRNS